MKEERDDSGGDCRRRGLLVDYLYGGLPGGGGERESLDRHLITCASCRAELAELTGARGLLDARPIPEPDPGIMAGYLRFLRRIAPERRLTERLGLWIERWLVRPPAVLRLAEVGLAVLAGVLIGSGGLRQPGAPEPSVVRIYADAATLQKVLGDAEMIILETVNFEAPARAVEVDERIDQSLGLLRLAADLRGQDIRRLDPELDRLLYQLTEIIQLISAAGPDDYPDRIDAIRDRVRSSHILARIADFRSRPGTVAAPAEGI